MLLLCLTGIVLLAAGLMYAPKSLFNPKSEVSKQLEKIKKYNHIIGFLAMGLGITLVGLFVFHVMKEVKWVVVLIVSLCSFAIGVTFSAKVVKNLINNKVLNKLIEAAEDIEESLKRSFSPKFIAIILMVLGFIGILSALTFKF